MERVTLTIADDDSRPGGGHACLLFEGVAPRSARNLALTLRRGGESDTWLGPSGWQASEHRFESQETRTEGRNLAVIVGPEVVNLVEAYTTVMAILPDLQICGVATWEATPAFSVAAETPEPVSVPFQLMPGGTIGFLGRVDKLGDLAPPAELLEGQAYLHVGYGDLRRAFQGKLEIDPARGTARLLPGPEEPPETIAYTAEADGSLILRGGGLSRYKARTAPDESVFGLESALLAALGQGLLRLDPVTLEARPIEPEKTGDDPPSSAPSSLKKRRLGFWTALVLVFLAVASGTATLLYLSEPKENQRAEAPPQVIPSLMSKQLYDKGFAAFGAGEFDKARDLLRQAEAGGNREAALFLAQAIDSLGFETGLFAAADDIEALRLYAEACRPGENIARTPMVAEARTSLKGLRKSLEAQVAKDDAIAADTLSGPFKKAEDQCQ
ncbi:MAG: hypothetical protein GDA41_09920 [Rhodospirillales bacterium]|nr:hypothetical protein [Rhodospirillales bacterium]